MKLLNRTIRSYLVYAITALVISIPLFYFVVRSVLLHSVDHSLRTQMKEIRSNLGSLQSTGELAAWSKMDKDIRLEPASQPGPDRLATVYRISRRGRHEDPFRELSGIIEVDGKFYTLVISNSLVENQDLLGSIVIVQSLLLAILMAGLLLINRRLSKKIWQPFYSILESMKRFELSSGRSIPPQETDILEFRELQQAVQNLVEKNASLYQKQREFTENASHELQTPLAIMQGKIDLLMQTQPLTGEQAKLITGLEQVNQRMSRLNKSLLLLAKIDNNQFFQTEPLNLEALVRATVEQFRAQAEHRGLEIREQFEPSGAITANKALLEILLSNLVSNAIRHNLAGGSILVQLDKDHFTVSNTGLAGAMDREKIFEKFYKSGDHAGSIGLGLAIARQVCDLYHFRLEYTHSGSMHRFRVSFTGG